jgi:hypothetical protein
MKVPAANETKTKCCECGCCDFGGCSPYCGGDCSGCNDAVKTRNIINTHCYCCLLECGCVDCLLTNFRPQIDCDFHLCCCFKKTVLPYLPSPYPNLIGLVYLAATAHPILTPILTPNLSQFNPNL